MVCRLPDEGDNQDSIAKCSRSEQGLASNSVVVTDWWNHSFHAISVKWQAARCNVRSTRSNISSSSCSRQTELLKPIQDNRCRIKHRRPTSLLIIIQRPSRWPTMSEATNEVMNKHLFVPHRPSVSSHFTLVQIRLLTRRRDLVSMNPDVEEIRQAERHAVGCRFAVVVDDWIAVAVEFH